jgi:hypothetical protein
LQRPFVEHHGSTPIDLGTLADLADIVSALTVLGGVVYAAIQIRQYRQQRLDAAALEVVRSMQNPELLRAFRKLRNLPDACPLAKLREFGPEFEDGLIVVGATFEALGVLVFRRHVPVQVVQQTLGGSITLLWRKCSACIREMRTEQNHETLFEWFQWLTERLAEVGEAERIPAYRAHAKRRPG